MEAPPVISHIEPGSVGPAKEINAAIRRDLQGTTSRCEEGPPSAKERADWKRLSQPRELEAVPLVALVKKPEQDLVFEVYSRLLDRLYTVGFTAMTRAEQNVYLVRALEAEVKNGGFDQFFSNSSGNCALRTSAALAEMPGFSPWAAIYGRALQRFPSGRPSEDRATRGAQLDAMSDESRNWWSIEGDFFKLPSSDPLLAAYIRGRISSFPKVVPRP